MGNPKQKWTTEEEDALRAGVNKHGTGKWKDIQRDPEFNQHLFSRSNIDLKDKWRNMVGGGSGQSARDKSRTGKAKPNQDSPSASAQLPNAAVVEDDAAADASNKASDDGKSVTPNNTWIFEALAFLKEQNPNGVDLGVIFNYIEQKHGVPQNFRRLLSSRLRRLVSQDKLERGSNGYKLKSDRSSSSVAAITTPTVTERDIKPRHFLQGTTVPSTATATATTTSAFGESIEDAAIEAAYKIADAENKAFIAADKVETAERVSKMAEEADAMLLFAKEILYRCSEDNLVFVA